MFHRHDLLLMAFLLFFLVLFSGMDCKQTSTRLDEVQFAGHDTDTFNLKTWRWEQHSIPPYSWPEGAAFGDGLFVDIAYDPNGVRVVDQHLRFLLDPSAPSLSEDIPLRINYRSEIRTAPWHIEHPLGTEQWIGWRYIFGKDYVADTTSPITIFQNHPGIRGLSPQFELEIAAKNRPRPALGGEIQIVNAANEERILSSVFPLAGDTLDVVVHVIYGRDEEGLLQVWFDGVLHYDKSVSTVYADQPWGGNNKWGIYHHTFNDSPTDLASSLAAGAGKVELLMGPLRLLKRSPHHPEYRENAYELVRPD